MQLGDLPELGDPPDEPSSDESPLRLLVPRVARPLFVVVVVVVVAVVAAAVEARPPLRVHPPWLLPSWRSNEERRGDSIVSDGRIEFE